MANTPLNPGESRYHHHPVAGDFKVSRFDGPHPVGLEFFCCGRYYSSEEQAVESFSLQCHIDVPEVEDRTYERMEARMIRPGVFEED